MSSNVPISSNHIDSVNDEDDSLAERPVNDDDFSALGIPNDWWGHRPEKLPLSQDSTKRKEDDVDGSMSKKKKDDTEEVSAGAAVNDDDDILPDPFFGASPTTRGDIVPEELQLSQDSAKRKGDGADSSMPKKKKRKDKMETMLGRWTRESRIDESRMDAEKLPILVQALEQNAELESLELTFKNPLSNQVPLNRLAGALGTSQYLHVLVIKDSAIGDEDAEDLVAGLGKHKKINSLTISGHGMGKAGFDALADLLTLEWGITTLHITGFRQTGVEDPLRFKKFAEKLEINQTLMVLSLQGNGLVDKDVELLAEVLQRNSKLQTLNLKDNYISNEGATAISTALNTNRTLKDLLWSDKNIDSQISNHIKELLENNKALSVLNSSLTRVENKVYALKSSTLWDRCFLPLIQERLAAVSSKVAAGPTLRPSAPQNSNVQRKDQLARTGFSIEKVIDPCLDALKRRAPNLLICGPPGASKTHLALALAEYYFPDEKIRNARVFQAQMHPSYTYEQFFEGLAPKLTEGSQSNSQEGSQGSEGISFGIQPGLLKLAADKARRRSPEERATNPGEDHDLPEDYDGPRAILILDELNRCDVPKVFGELFFMIEYRDTPMTLQYSSLKKETFSIPSELAIIATMNTADRSISTLDAALRRRFFTVEIDPDVEILKKLYDKDSGTRRIGGANCDVEGLIKGIEALNDQVQRLLTPDHRFGHALFLPQQRRDGTFEDFGPRALRNVWNGIIFPQLREYFHGRRARELANFKLDEFWKDNGWRVAGSGATFVPRVQASKPGQPAKKGNQGAVQQGNAST